MAGKRNEEIESVIRKVLKRQKMQLASDREVAKEAGCSKNTVRRVRTVMIHAGLIPQPPPHRGKAHSKGAIAIRGGYVMLPSGKVITAVEYLKRKKS